MAKNNIMAPLAYIGELVSGMGWLSGLVVYFLAKDDRVAKFHGIQAILFSVVYTILYALVVGILVGIVFAVTIFGGNAVAGIASILWIAVALVAGLMLLLILVLWVWAMWQAFNDRMYKMPLIGGFAEKWA